MGVSYFFPDNQHGSRIQSFLSLMDHIFPFHFPMDFFFHAHTGHGNRTQCLRVEFLLKLETHSGYPKDTGVDLFTLATPGNPLRYNTHWSAPPVSALTHFRGPRKRSQSRVDMLEHRDTYGQAQICSKGHQGSSVDRPMACQPSFYWIKFWHVWNPLPQSIRLRLSVLVRYWAGQGE